MGTTQTLTATGTFSDQSTQNLGAQVNWLSSNPQAATVSGSGFVGSKINVQGGCTVVGASYVFNAPSGLAVDSNGNVYVADAVDSKVVVVRAP